MQTSIATYQNMRRKRRRARLFVTALFLGAIAGAGGLSAYFMRADRNGGSLRKKSEFSDTVPKNSAETAPKQLGNTSSASWWQQAVRDYLTQNLDDPKFEEVRWWEPIDPSRIMHGIARQMIAGDWAEIVHHSFCKSRLLSLLSAAA